MIASAFRRAYNRAIVPANSAVLTHELGPASCRCRRILFRHPRGAAIASRRPARVGQPAGAAPAQSPDRPARRLRLFRPDRRQRLRLPAAVARLYRRVVLLGPAHRVRVRGLALPANGLIRHAAGERRTRSGCRAGPCETCPRSARATKRTPWNIRSKCTCRSCSRCWPNSRWCRSRSVTRQAEDIAQVLDALWGGRGDADRRELGPFALPALCASAPVRRSQHGAHDPRPANRI